MLRFVVILLALSLHVSEQAQNSSITIHPSNTTSNEGQNATLVCVVTGNPTPTVQWYKDGLLLNNISANPRLTQDPDSNSLIITDLIRNDEGFYACKATNNISSVTSNQAYLTVNFKPKILIDPLDEIRNERQNVTLSCRYEGKPVTDALWYRNNTRLDGSSDSRITISRSRDASLTESCLTITKLNRRDEGRYKCQVNNTVGGPATSQEAQLTMNYAPVIFAPPLALTNNETNSVTFSCLMEGKPQPNVIWTKNGTDVDVDGDNRITTAHPWSYGNSTATMTIRNVKKSDEGWYVCVANNGVAAAVTSAAAKLRVHYGVTIFEDPQPKSKIEGESVTFTCEVEGKPAPNVTWLVNDNPLTIETSRMNVTQPTTHDRTVVYVTINDLKRTDEGSYSCSVKNSYGEKNSNAAALTVNYLPKILVPPTSKTVVERSNVSLTCYFEGKPLSNVTWLKDGHPMIAANGDRISMPPPSSVSNTSATISITNVNRTDEGYYSCQAVNDVGNVTSSGALLTVNYPPVIFQNPVNLTKSQGNSMVMSCGVDGNPVPEVTWKKDVVTLVHDGRINITNPSGVGRVYSTLTISNLGWDDEGTYKCVGNNTLNAVVSLPGRLTIISLDLWFVNPEANFTVTAGQSATLICEVWGESPDITWYRDGKSMGATRIRAITSGKRTEAELTFNNVQAENSGVYTCTASSSIRSISTQMTLVVSVPIEVDMDVTVENMAYSAELNNKSSPRFQNLSNTFKKEISSIYKNMEGFKEVQVLGFSNGSVQVVFRVIFEIKVNKPTEKPPTDVRQKVANTAIEEISKTNGFIGTLKFKPGSLTPLVPPPSPRNLKASEVNVKQISIAWNKPEYHQTYGVTGYEVQYKKFAGEEWNNIPVQGKDVNDYVINDLKQETKYLMKIFAVNKRGNGPPSNQLEVRTDKQNIWTKIWTEYKWVIVAVGIILLLLVLTGIFLCCRRRRRQNNEVMRQQSVRRNQGNFSISGQSFRNNGFEMAQLASKFREIPREQIMIGKELGSGQFGLVTRGYLKQDRMHCAIKMLKDSAPHSHYRDLLNELDIMSSIEDHPNIVNLIGACTQGGPVYLVVELAEYGSLLDFLHNNQMYSISHREKVSILTESQKIRISRDVARGLEHLAGYRCVHRDLAARNVLLGTNMTAKLSDFGLARDVYERGYYQQLSDMKKLPVRWMSIEAIETIVATKESDIWSFGVLMWEIYSGGKLPFLGLSAKDVLKTLKKGTRLSQPIDCSDEIYAIMMSCWHSSPLKRPSIDLLATVLDRQLQLRRNDENNLDSSMA